MTESSTEREILTEAYDAFNARDIARALAAMHPEVDWPNGMEFGSSGRVFDKQQIIAALQHEPAIQRSLLDFRTTVLAPGVVLVTYRIVLRHSSEELPRHVLRSSIWKLVAGRWQMVFHQATVAKEPCVASDAGRV